MLNPENQLLCKDTFSRTVIREKRKKKVWIETWQSKAKAPIPTAVESVVRWWLLMQKGCTWGLTSNERIPLKAAALSVISENKFWPQLGSVQPLQTPFRKNKNRKCSFKVVREQIWTIIFTRGREWLKPEFNNHSTTMVLSIINWIPWLFQKRDSQETTNSFLSICKQLNPWCLS